MAEGSASALTVYTHKFADGRVFTALFDGKRRIATARPVSGGYLVKGDGLCLLDKKPHPTTPNKFGIVNPQMYHVTRARDATRAIERLAQIRIKL